MARPRTKDAAKTVSFYLDEDAVAVLSARERDDVARSGTLEAILLRYAALCERDRPALGVQEWKLIFDALNGCWMIDRPDGVLTFLRAEVTDHIAQNKADAKWGVDGKALLRRLANLTYGQAIA